MTLFALSLRRFATWLSRPALFAALLLAVATPARADHIVILGDSLSAGYGIARDKSWPTLLGERLSEQHRLTNASVSGETTAGGLARLPALLDDAQVDVLVIELGGNDGLRGYPLTSIRSNLQKMITLGEQHGAQVLLLGMRIPPNYGRRYAEGFHELYFSLAEKNALPLVPFLLEGVAQDPALMQDDGIHPTAQAQPLILDIVWPHLQPLLADNAD